MNKFLTIFTLLSSLIIFKTSIAQSNIEIKVTDSNGNPIDNAYVALGKNSANGVTDLNGTVILENISNGTYKLTISHLGYKAIQDIVTVNQNALSLSYILETDLLYLNSVVITGNFSPNKSLESANSISLLSTKDIEKIYPQGTADLLQNIPGTFTDPSAGEVFTKVYTRGISASAEDDTGWYYVSLQEDGLPVSLVQHSYYSPDIFHRVDLTTKKVEAIRGGSSTITALNAPGGIYNFISHGVKNAFGGDIQLSTGIQGDGNSLYELDGVIGGPMGNNWHYNIGGHYRKDDGARNTDFTFSQGGQVKFNLIKQYASGYLKFYGKILNDKTNRHTGVAAINWDNPTPAFGQDFRSTSLLMPSYDANIPDGRHLSQNVSNAFNPSQGVHAKDVAFGLEVSQNLGNNWLLNNNFKFSAKDANWQTSISNAFVSINNPLAYFVSGANFPIGQVVFRETGTGVEVARLDNSGILAGQPAVYLGAGTLPNDAIMGTSAWYKENEADEFVNQFTLTKDFDNHKITTGVALGYSDASLFTQGSFAYVTYEPNPRMLQVTLENPGSSTIALSDSNGVSNYGGLFFVNAKAQVSQLSVFVNDRYKLSDKLQFDIGLRYEAIKHKGHKDRFAPFVQSGGLDGNENTAYDNGILAPTGEQDRFNYNYNYLSFSGGLNYKLGNQAALFGRISKGNKAPELNYYFNNFSNVPINGKGEIQKITQVELGIKYAFNDFSFTGTAFWSQLKDIGIANFEFDADDNSIFYTPIQFNTSRTIGLEWESIYSPFKYFTVGFNGVLQNPKATDWKVYNASGTVDTNDDSITDYSGNILPFNPKVMFNLYNEFEKGKVSAFLKWQFMSERQGNVSNGFKLPSYSIFNSGLGYKINKHMSANMIVTNLFNSEGLANFFGANSFGANANGATPEFISANPNASFVVFPVLQRRILFRLNYSF